MKYKPVIVSAYFRECGLPEPVYEHRFHETRLWRFDLAFPEQRIYIEVDGGIFIQGSHNRGAQMIKNWEKRNAASVLGWRGLWCQPKDLCTLEMVELIRECLEEAWPALSESTQFILDRIKPIPGLGIP